MPMVPLRAKAMPCFVGLSEGRKGTPVHHKRLHFPPERKDVPVTGTDDSRPIGNTPITDASAATAHQSSSSDSSAYPSAVSSNADLRTKEDNADAAAMTATGADVANDHADEGPIDRSQDAPETFNSEQDDEAAQAQTVAEDAVRGIADRDAAQESEHGGSSNPAQILPDDAQDVVDHMNQMERSGQIDMDAYRGERSDDDEPDTLGEAALEPDDVDSHGNRPKAAY